MRSAVSVLLFVVACGSSSEPRQDTAPAPAPAGRAAPAAPAPAAAPAPVQARDDVNPRLLRRFKPLRAAFSDGVEPATAAQIQLGRMLFFDKRLSHDRDVSCNTCHPLDQYGVDRKPTSTGAKGQRGHRNSPSVYHAAGAFTNFWDGRAANVEEQAKGPILNPSEMAMGSPGEVIATLATIPGYVAAFRAAFPGSPAISYDNIGRAIGAFERRLVTPSRWDRYLAGDHSVLAAQEITGLKLFTDIGCMTCHTGELVGGSMFQKVGVAKPWPNQQDRGRVEVTKLPSDAMVFKVPSLRNVAKTPPYFHDGSAATLEEAVRLMARHQVGEELSDDDVRAIVAWLSALTGDLPTDYIAAPTLPADSSGRS